MGHPNLKIRQRIAILNSGLEIWKVHLDCIREQDRNARFMSPAKFKRLSENIKDTGRLESLPYVHNTTPDDVETEFKLISGHHRVRAARDAGLQEIFVLVDVGSLSRAKIVSKQLAHNALSGMDDPQVLSQLYTEIDELEARIASGLTDQDIKIPDSEVRVDDISIDIDYEIINVVFLPRDFKRFKEMLDMLEEEAQVYIADKADFAKFKAEIQKVSKFFNVVNVAAIMAKIIDIVGEYFGNMELVDADTQEGWMPFTIGEVRGNIPPEVYARFLQAWDMAKFHTSSEKVTPNFEAIIADFLSGSTQA